MNDRRRRWVRAGMWLAASAEGYDEFVDGLSPARRWKLEESSGTTLFDEEGVSDFSLSGSYNLAQAAPASELGDGIEFVDGYAEAPASTDLDSPSALTVAVWVEFHDLSAATEFATILAKNGSDGSTSSMDWGLNLRDSGKAMFRLLDSSASTTNNYQALTDTLTVDTLYLIIGEWDGSRNRMYLNGNNLESASIEDDVGSPTNSHSTLRLGGVADNTDRRIEGTIYDAMIFDRVLTGTEKDNLYTQGTA